ncbi:MAG: sigma-70 family RNA polymerase sigma factor, partial [Clostridia bacterium]|nr:sigma-70 family RNA polymerase sigma factor [Clostridia bacterium]
MTEKQSTKALISAAQQGDLVALEQLVEQNNGLIYSVLKRFLNRGQSREDLYQIGCIGLLKAIKRFDFSLNLQFSTYAVSLILGELKQFFRDDGMIKVSREWKALAIRAATVQQEQEKKRGQELT